MLTVFDRDRFISVEGGGCSAVTNPSQGVSGDWDVTTDHPRLRLIHVCRGQTIGNRLFYSYPCPANKLKTNAPEVSTRQAVPDRKI